MFVIERGRRVDRVAVAVGRKPTGDARTAGVAGVLIVTATVAAGSVTARTVAAFTAIVAIFRCARDGRRLGISSGFGYRPFVGSTFNIFGSKRIIGKLGRSIGWGVGIGCSVSGDKGTLGLTGGSAATAAATTTAPATASVSSRSCLTDL